MVARYIKQQIKLYKKLSTNTWAGDSEAITLTTANLDNVNEGIGKLIDNASFRIVNTNKTLYHQYFSGTGAQTQFQLLWYPVPVVYQTDITKFQVYVDSAQKTSGWSINNSTGIITFTSAPASGTRNVEIRWSLIEADDQIKIWRWADSGSAPSTPLFDGVVIEPPETIDDNGRLLQVKCKNWIEILFDTLAYVDSGDTPRTADVIIKGWTGDVLPGGNTGTNIGMGLLTFLNNYAHANQKIYWDPQNATPPNGKSDKYVEKYKSAIEVLEDLSSGDWIGSGSSISYMFWVNSSGGYNYLRWTPRDTAVTTTLAEGTDVIQSINVTKKTDEIINVILFNCGNTPQGVPIHYVNANWTSVGKLGPKWKYWLGTQSIAGTVLQDEKDADTAHTKFTWYQDSAGNWIASGNFPAAYGYSFAKVYNRDSTYPFNITDPATLASAATRGDFNTIVRTEAIAKGLEQTGRLLVLWGAPRYFVDMELPVTLNYTKGSILSTTVSSYNIYSENLRLTEVKHRLWDTQLTLEEDEGTI